MKKTIKFILTAGAIFVLVVIIGYLIFSDGTRLEMVQHGEMEKSYSFEAIIIRDETVITSEKTGVLESMVQDNEMVRKNKHIASIYESEIDDDAKNKLTHINNRIDEISKVNTDSSEVVSGTYQVEAAIDDKVKEMRTAIENSDVDKIVNLENDFSLLNDRKNTIKNGVEYTDEMLSALKKEKEKYEKKLGGAKQDLFSPVSGVYSTNIDGYEQIVTPDAIGTMTPYDFESISKMNLSAKDNKEKGNVCKIIDTFSWSVAFVADESQIAKLKEGTGVYVRGEGSSADYKASISYISAPEKGRYLVIATSNVNCEWSMKDRFVRVDIIKNKYKGLKVPVNALRVVEGKTGVYTVVDGIVHFKKVKVLYKDESYAIVEENNVSTGGLLLYDEVVVTTRKKIKEGDKIS